MKDLVQSIRRLASVDVNSDSQVTEAVDSVFKSVKNASAGSSNNSPKQSVDADNSLIAKIDRFASAIKTPADNYRRMEKIVAGVRRLAMISERSGNSDLKEKTSRILVKLAGVFKEVDTVSDLDRPLEEIEKAVHSLYGDQSKNSTYYFERRGKGHSGEKALLESLSPGYGFDQDRRIRRCGSR